MDEGEPNSFVREKTCIARNEGINREIKDMKKDIEKLDNRIWWIVGSAILTFVMSAAQLYIATR